PAGVVDLDRVALAGALAGALFQLDILEARVGGGDLFVLVAFLRLGGFFLLVRGTGTADRQGAEEQQTREATHGTPPENQPLRAHPRRARLIRIGKWSLP